MLFSEASQLFLRFTKIYKSNDTFNFYKSHIINLNFDHYSLDQINITLVEDYIISCKNKGLTNSTINKRILTLRCVLKHVHADKIIEDLKIIPKLKEEEKTFNYLSYIQVCKLLDYLSNSSISLENKLVFRLFLDTGVRLSELLDIRVDNIDFSTNSIRLLHTKVAVQRYVFFTDETAGMLKKYLYITKSPKLFNYTKSGIASLFYRVNQQLNFKNFSPHVLRHTYATILVNHNTNLEFIRSTLGHHSLEVTKRYLHYNQEQLFKVYKERFNYE